MMNIADTLSPSDQGDTPRPRLPEHIESKIFENIDELAMVESNILGSGQDIRTLYVTSCNNFEGKTIAAIQLAWALTINTQAKTLLVDGNPRRPAIASLFGLGDVPGLSDYIYKDLAPKQTLYKTVYDKLTVMPLGQAKTERPFLIQPGHFDRFKKLIQQFEYVVIDGNKLLGSSDSILMSKLFDGVLLTLACEQTKWSTARHALEKLNNVKANVLGVVLNKRNYYIPKVLYGKS